MSEGGIVIGLHGSDREGKGGQGVLGEGFGGGDRDLFAELNQAQAGMTVDGGVLVEFVAFDKIRDMFDVDLEQISGAGNDKSPAIAFGSRSSWTGQPGLFDDLSDGKGGRNAFEALIKQELA